MSPRFTPEQFHEYQRLWNQPVEDGDMEGRQKKQNAGYWVAYCYLFETGGVASEEEGQQILEQVIQEQDSIDGDDHHDNTGKHRSLLAYIMTPNQFRDELYRQAVPRLEIEVQENDENYREAAFWLGKRLVCLHKDVPRGIHWLKVAAELGHERAQHTIGLDCFKEPFVAELFSWLQQIADENYNPWAQCQLGICHKNGLGVKKDLVKAVEWYNKAITQGYDDATWYKSELLRRLCPQARSKTLGCAARNQKIEKATSLVQQSFVGGVPLSLWAHALASFQHQENPPWEALSPTFLSLKDAIMPQLREQLKKRQMKNRKRDLQSGN